MKYQEVHNCFGDKILNIFSDNVIVWSQKQLCYCDFNGFCLWIALRWPQDRRGLQKPKHIIKIYIHRRYWSSWWWSVNTHIHTSLKWIMENDCSTSWTGSICGLLAVLSFTDTRLSPSLNMNGSLQLNPPVFPGDKKHQAFKSLITYNKSEANWQIHREVKHKIKCRIKHMPRQTQASNREGKITGGYYFFNIWLNTITLCFIEDVPEQKTNLTSFILVSLKLRKNIHIYNENFWST